VEELVAVSRRLHDKERGKVRVGMRLMELTDEELKDIWEFWSDFPFKYLKLTKHNLIFEYEAAENWGGTVGEFERKWENLKRSQMSKFSKLD